MEKIPYTQEYWFKEANKNMNYLLISLFFNLILLIKIFYFN